MKQACGWRRTLQIGVALAVCAAATAAADRASAPDAPRPRLLVLTDIGGDPDDMQSMRRLMLYSNEFEIEGLIATASGTPGELGREVTQPDLIREIIRDYAAVRGRLLRHAAGYPTAESLLRVVRSGSAKRGVAHLGRGRSTPGSDLIIRAVDESPEPLWVAVWGGCHDLAQALFDVRAGRDPEDVARFVAKLRVYAITDQDAQPGQPGTGEWIRERFPELRYVETAPPGMNRFAALFRGMYQNDSAGGGAPLIQLVRDPVIPLNQQAWVEKNVRTGHGPLGAGYPLVRQNPTSPHNTLGVKEGDTPSWFFVLPNGLGDPEHPEYGGWGGRFRKESGGHWVDAEDEHWSGSRDPAVRRKWTVARWREAYQNDFAARLDWCVAESYAAANHNPMVVLNGDGGKRILRIPARAGDPVKLSAAGSRDPDGDRLNYHWFVYREAGTCRGEVSLEARGPEARFTAPGARRPCQIHVVCEVIDDGSPPLHSYRRAVVTVEPK